MAADRMRAAAMIPKIRATRAKIRFSPIIRRSGCPGGYVRFAGRTCSCAATSQTARSSCASGLRFGSERTVRMRKTMIQFLLEKLFSGVTFGGLKFGRLYGFTMLETNCLGCSRTRARRSFATSSASMSPAKRRDRMSRSSAGTDSPVARSRRNVPRTPPRSALQNEVIPRR